MLSILPKDILTIIFSRLSIENLGNMSCSAKVFHKHLSNIMHNLYIERSIILADIAVVIEHNLDSCISYILVFHKDFQKLKVFAQFPKPYKVVVEHKLKRLEGARESEFIQRESYTMYSFLRLTECIKTLCNKNQCIMNTLLFPQTKKVKGII